MKIVLGADHNGVQFKEALKEHLLSSGHECVDVGSTGEASVDYPDYAFLAAEMVSRGDADRGVLICGSGIGMCMAANKVLGIRAALCGDVEAARLTRAHNDANVLAIAGWQTRGDDVFDIVDMFLDTPFDGGRHARRVDKIMDYEKKRKS
ncbi:MAG: ribose 5-phosphate isomerase B [Chitinivibrionia bacterium]|nr:ribose 5-phosphate isomerase B [Chitinivibrionia bacterium]